MSLGPVHYPHPFTNFDVIFSVEPQKKALDKKTISSDVLDLHAKGTYPDAPIQMDLWRLLWSEDVLNTHDRMGPDLFGDSRTESDAMYYLEKDWSSRQDPVDEPIILLNVKSSPLPGPSQEQDIEDDVFEIFMHIYFHYAFYVWIEEQGIPSIFALMFFKIGIYDLPLLDYPLEYPVVLFHPSCALPEKIGHASLIQPLRLRSSQVRNDYVNQFRFWMNQHRQPIYVVLPHRAHWRSVSLAEQAALGKSGVEVIDSRTYGLGLSVLAYHLMMLVSRRGFRFDIKTLFNRLIPLLCYWVVPLDIKPLKKRRWFNRFWKSYTQFRWLRASVVYPVLTLVEPMGIFSAHDSVSEAVMEILKQIREVVKDRRHLPYRIIVESSSGSSEAKLLIKQLRRYFPEVQVISKPLHHYLENRFGDHIGVALI